MPQTRWSRQEISARQPGSEALSVLQFSSVFDSAVFVQVFAPYSVPQSCSTFLIKKREKFQNVLPLSAPLHTVGCSRAQRDRARINARNCEASSGSDGGSSTQVSPISCSTTGSVCRTVSSCSKNASYVLETSVAFGNIWCNVE